MGRLIDLTGKKFGRLTVLERDNSIDTKKGAFWICKCSCGNKKSISSRALREGVTKSCGCLNKEIISMPKDLSYMVGKRFGRLTIIKRVENHITPSGQKKVMWLCQCDCGNKTTVSSQDLKSGHTKSCGCLPTKQKGDGLIDLVGQRFGTLVVLKRVDDYTYQSSTGKATTSPRWLCQCDCGGFAIVQGGNLRNGNTTHCGCKNIKSKGEMLIADFLSNNNIKYVREYSFDDLKNKSGRCLRFDFGILDNNNNITMLVEYQGAQHYIDCGSFGAYQRKYSDKAKRKYCEENNILLYEIRFDENLTHAMYDLLNEIKNKKKKYNNEIYTPILCQAQFTEKVKRLSFME